MFSEIENKLKKDIEKFRADACKAKNMSIVAGYEPNQKEYENMEKLYSSLNRDSILKPFKVKYEFNKSISGIGYVSVYGRKIKIKDVENFSNFINLATTFEIYTKLDGEVVINFGFNNLDKDWSN